MLVDGTQVLLEEVVGALEYLFLVMDDEVHKNMGLRNHLYQIHEHIQLQHYIHLVPIK